MTLQESRPSVRLGKIFDGYFRPPSNKGFVDISDARQKSNEKKKRSAPSNADLASLPKKPISLSGILAGLKRQGRIYFFVTTGRTSISP
jgi:hypothetical protein